LKKLMAHFGDRVRLIEVLVRQGHPGPEVPCYGNFEQKLRDGYRYKELEGIPWTVLVDDLRGTVHQAYGSLADPTYLIDNDGRVAYYNVWTHVPTLFRAVQALLAREGRGVVLGGVDRKPHFGATLTNGWPALRRGLPQSAVDLETSVPLSAVGPWLGYQLRPLLAPLTLRERPLPRAAKAALGAAAVAAIMFGVRRALRGAAEATEAGNDAATGDNRSNGAAVPRAQPLVARVPAGVPREAAELVARGWLSPGAT